MTLSEKVLMDACAEFMADFLDAYHRDNDQVVYRMRNDTPNPNGEQESFFTQDPIPTGEPMVLQQHFLTDDNDDPRLNYGVDGGGLGGVRGNTTTADPETPTPTPPPPSVGSYAQRFGADGSGRSRRLCLLSEDTRNAIRERFKRYRNASAPFYDNIYQRRHRHPPPPHPPQSNPHEGGTGANPDLFPPTTIVDVDGDGMMADDGNPTHVNAAPYATPAPAPAPPFPLPAPTHAAPCSPRPPPPARSRRTPFQHLVPHAAPEEGEEEEMTKAKEEGDVSSFTRTAPCVKENNAADEGSVNAAPDFNLKQDHHHQDDQRRPAWVLPIGYYDATIDRFVYAVRCPAHFIVDFAIRVVLLPHLLDQIPHVPPCDLNVSGGAIFALWVHALNKQLWRLYWHHHAWSEHANSTNNDENDDRVNDADRFSSWKLITQSNINNSSANSIGGPTAINGTTANATTNTTNNPQSRIHFCMPVEMLLGNLPLDFTPDDFNRGLKWCDTMLWPDTGNDAPTRKRVMIRQWSSEDYPLHHVFINQYSYIVWSDYYRRSNARGDGDASHLTSIVALGKRSACCAFLSPRHPSYCLDRGPRFSGSRDASSYERRFYIWNAEESPAFVRWLTHLSRSSPLPRSVPTLLWSALVVAFGASCHSHALAKKIGMPYSLVGKDHYARFRSQSRTMADFRVLCGHTEAVLCGDMTMSFSDLHLSPMGTCPPVINDTTNTATVTSITPQRSGGGAFNSSSSSRHDPTPHNPSNTPPPAAFRFDDYYLEDALVRADLAANPAVAIHRGVGTSNGSLFTTSTPQMQDGEGAPLLDANAVRYYYYDDGHHNDGGTAGGADDPFLAEGSVPLSGVTMNSTMASGSDTQSTSNGCDASDSTGSSDSNEARHTSDDDDSDDNDDDDDDAMAAMDGGGDGDDDASPTASSVVATSALIPHRRPSQEGAARWEGTDPDPDPSLAGKRVRRSASFGSDYGEDARSGRGLRTEGDDTIPSSVPTTATATATATAATAAEASRTVLNASSPTPQDDARPPPLSAGPPQPRGREHHAATGLARTTVPARQSSEDSVESADGDANSVVVVAVPAAPVAVVGGTGTVTVGSVLVAAAAPVPQQTPSLPPPLPSIEAARPPTAAAAPLCESVSYAIAGVYPVGPTASPFSSPTRGSSTTTDQQQFQQPQSQRPFPLRVSLSSPPMHFTDADIVVASSVSTRVPVALTWWLAYGSQRVVLNLDQMVVDGLATTYQISATSFILTFRPGTLAVGWDYAVCLSAMTASGASTSAETTFSVSMPPVEGAGEPTDEPAHVIGPVRGMSVFRHPLGY